MNNEPCDQNLHLFHNVFYFMKDNCNVMSLVSADAVNLNNVKCLSFGIELRPLTITTVVNIDTITQW